MTRRYTIDTYLFFVKIELGIYAVLFENAEFAAFAAFADADADAAKRFRFSANLIKFNVASSRIIVIFRRNSR